MAFNYQSAIQAGYTPQEIDQYQNQNKPSQPKQNNGGGFLSGLLNAARGFGLGAIQDIAAPIWMGGTEMGQGYSPIAGVGKQAPLNVLQQDAQSNPFANQQQLQKMGGTLPQAAKQVGQDTAGAMSYMVPFGQGANIATKAILPGLATGALQGISDPNATPGSVAGNMIAGEAGGLVGHGVGALIGKAAGVLPKVGNTITNGADSMLRSQYNVTPTVSKDLSLPEATQFLAKNYGIVNKDQAVEIANKVIPLLTKVRNQALENLPAADLGNLNHVVNDALEPAVLLSDTAKNNFLQHVKHTLNYSADGTQIVKDNPQKVMYGISQLEDMAHLLSMSKDPSSQQLARAYTTVARTMEDRLGNGYINPDSGIQTNGINGVPIQDLLLQKGEDGMTPLENIHAMNPHLGMTADNLETLRQLRHLEAPFVTVSRAAQAAEDANKHNVISPLGLGGGIFLSHVNPLLGLAYFGGKGVINSNASKTAIAKSGLKIGNALQNSNNLNPVLAKLLSSLGSRGASSVTNAAQQ